MTADHYTPPSALAPASNDPMLSEDDLDAKAALIIEQVTVGRLTPFQGGSLLWACAEHSVVLTQVIDEQMDRMSAYGDATAITREQITTHVSDKLGVKLTEQVDRPKGYQFSVGREGKSFAAWVRHMGRSIAMKGGRRIDGYERRAVAVIDGPGGRERSEGGVDAQHRANQIVNAALTSGRPTTIAADSGHGDPCEIVLRHEAHGILSAADWEEVLAQALKEVPNAHKPALAAQVFLRSKGIEVPARPHDPRKRERVRTVLDTDGTDILAAVLWQKAGEGDPDDEDGPRVQPDPGLLSHPDAALFRDICEPLSNTSARMLAGRPEQAAFVVRRLIGDRPNRGVGPVKKMQTLGRRAAKRAGLNPAQAAFITHAIDSYLAWELEPYPQRWRGGTDLDRRNAQERHRKLRGSFLRDLARLGDLPGKPLGGEKAILRWLHDSALASGAIERDPFAVHTDLDGVIRKVMGFGC